MNQRNPIIEIPYEDTVYRIQIIGDPHFGKTFKTGVPTSKIGIREEYQLNTFKELLNTSDIDHFIIMGDLFDKFVVNNEILIKVYMKKNKYPQRYLSNFAVAMIDTYLY